jgi:hypothetical protein
MRFVALCRRNWRTHDSAFARAGREPAKKNGRLTPPEFLSLRQEGAERDVARIASSHFREAESIVVHLNRRHAIDL